MAGDRLVTAIVTCLAGIDASAIAAARALLILGDARLALEHGRAEWPSSVRRGGRQATRAIERGSHRPAPA